MAYHVLEQLIKLHEGYRRHFRIGQHELLLLQHCDEVLLLDNRCPHQGHTLHRGTIKNDVLYCPRHGFAFHLPSGRCVNDVAETVELARRCPGLRFYRLAYQDRTVGVVL